MTDHLGDAWECVAGSYGNKKWVSATAVADHGDSQAIAVAPLRRSFTAFQVGPSMFSNRSGTAAVMGIGVRFRTSSWGAGTVTSAEAYTDATAQAQDATTDDFPLHNHADGGSGFMLSADERFNTFAVIKSVGGDQTGPLQVIEYWNGTSWISWGSTAFINDALDTSATGERVVSYPMPFDWVKGGFGAGVPQTRYNLRVTQAPSGAGTTDPLAAQIFLGFCKVEVTAIPTAQTVSLIREAPLSFPRSGDALFPLINQPSLLNSVELSYQFYA